MADCTVTVHQAVMAKYPLGIVIEIVCMLMADQCCSCEEQVVCSSVLAEDMVVRLCKVQVLVEGHEETTIACI